MRRVALTHCLGSAQLASQLRGQLMGRRTDPDRSVVEGGGGAFVALGGQVIGLEDESSQIARLERERLVHSGVRGRIVIEIAASVGKTKARGSVRLAGRDDPFERLACLAWVASAQGLDAGLGERARVDGWHVHDQHRFKFFRRAAS